MKTIGILGGMGWESTAVYYRVINQEVRRRAGGFHSAHLLIESFDFAVLADLQERGEWESVQTLLTAGALRLERAGADFVLIACNTVHRVTDELETRLGVPFLHIADSAGEALARRGIERAALLGTRHTMQSDFYQKRLAERFGIATLLPDGDAQERIHRLILDELVHGVASPAGRKTLDQIGEALASRGAQAVLLACTELGLLYAEHEVTGECGAPALPTLDTARLHAIAAVDRALA